MPRALLFLPLLLAAAHAANVFVIADTNNQTRAIATAVNESIAEATDIVFNDVNDTLTDGDHEPIVRKKRTFGDVVFRGLADVLGYNVARKPPQAFVFPPPVALVPGIDSPAQAGAAPPPATAAPTAPPCGAPRAAAPPPCRARQPPAQPKAQPPCPKPRAAPPRPKPTRPPPPPPPPPPCASPRANPTTAAPCAAAPQPKADSNLETINTNFRLNFNFNRALATPAPAAEADVNTDEEAPLEQAPINSISIQPRAAKLPPPAPRNPRVYVDAFVLRDGVAQRVNTIDAQNINRAQAADDDYLFYVDEEPQTQQDQQYLDDDYEDVQEPRDRSGAVREINTAVDQFWAQKQKPKQKLPANDYRKVHFGDRDLANQVHRRNNDNLQNLQRERPKPKRVPLPLPDETEGEEESEVTTTTQDPRRKLKPRVLPPTEHNPNQIDTVTVRVPPIYKEKRPKKLHRERPEAPDRDEDEEEPRRDIYQEDDSDTDSEQSAQVEQTEAPKRKRRRKKSRRVRSTYSEAYSAGDYDYYGKKLPISEEEEDYLKLTVPPPTRDADVARLEDAEDEGHFLDDHERLREDPERIQQNKSENDDREEESERSDESERSYDDGERTGEGERADEHEKTDKLSPNARVRETGYENTYVRAHNVQVDDPRPKLSVLKRKNTSLKKP